MRAIGAVPWPCIVHRYARYARLGVELAIDEVWPEKSTGLEKRRRLKDSGRSPDTYIIGNAEAFPILCVSDFCE